MDKIVTINNDFKKKINDIGYKALIFIITIIITVIIAKIVKSRIVNTIVEKNDKESILMRSQKIFLNFIIKFFDFENKILKIVNKLNLESNYNENDGLDDKLLFDSRGVFIKIEFNILKISLY